MNNEKIKTKILELLTLISQRKFEEAQHQTIGNLTVKEIEEIITDYEIQSQKKLSPFPQEFLEKIVLEKIDSPSPFIWSEIDLWFDHEQSDLTVIVNAEEKNNKIQIKIRDIHVL